MNYILKTNVIYIITITIVGVSLRYHFWPEASYGDREFYAVLNENFFEYIFFTSLNPPLNYIIPGIFVKIFGLEKTLPILQFVVFLDLVGLILIFISLQSIKLNKNIVFYFVFYLSVFYIPFEFWRNGTHYDHWTFFLNCLFIYFIVRLVKKPNTSSAIFLSLSGSLLILQSSVFSVIIPIVFSIIPIFIKESFKNFREFINFFVILVFLPLFLLFSIASKNYFISGTFASSNKGGLAQMLVFHRSFDRDIEIALDKVEKSNRPFWFKWCYKNAKTPWYEDEVAIVNAHSFGHCMPWFKLHKDTDNQVSLTENWLKGMEELQSSYLKIENEKQIKFDKVLKAISDDIYNLEYKPYLLKGYAPELSLNFVSLYASEGSKLFFNDMINNPIRYLKTFRLIFDDFTSGVFHPILFIRDGKAYGNQNITGNYFSLKSLSAFIKLNGHLVRYIVIPITIVVVIFTYFLIIFKYMTSFINKPKKTNFMSDYNFKVYSIISTIAILISLIFSTMSGEENDRYFMQAIPYYIFSFTILLDLFKKLPKQIHEEIV